MVRKLSVLFSALIVFLSFSASANICPASNAVGLPGIGDGCTTDVDMWTTDPTGNVTIYNDTLHLGQIFPDIGAWRGTFTPACNNHDKCYSMLGTTLDECNTNFLNDLKNICSSTVNPLLNPPLYLACRSTAQEYYEAVKYWANHSPSSDMQKDFRRDAIKRSANIQTSINADSCGTTPERTTLYSASLISHINSVFQTYAGRTPTIYEFLEAMNTPNPSGGYLYAEDQATWESYLVSKAQYAANIHPPVAGVSFTVSNPNDGNPASVTISANPVVQGAAYFWNLAKTSSGSSVKFSYNLEFSGTVQFSGYLKATDSAGIRNMAVFDQKYKITSCAGTTKKQSSC